MWGFMLLMGFLLVVKCENEYERDIYWRDYNRIIPEDAVNVGFGLYVGISLLDGYIVSGTINAEHGKFEGVFSKKHEKTEEVKILCSKNPLRFKWEYINGTNAIPYPPSDFPNLSKRLVKLPSNGRIYCIGRAFHENEWRIGFVNLQAMKIFYTWDNNRAVRQLNQYEILTYVDNKDKVLNNNVQPDMSSDLKVIKDDLLTKNNYFILSVASELEHLPEESRDLVKSAIWRIIYEVKRAKKSNVQLTLVNLTKDLPV